MTSISARAPMTSWLVDARSVGKAASFALGVYSTVAVEEKAGGNGIAVKGRGGMIAKSVASHIRNKFKHPSPPALGITVSSDTDSSSGLGFAESVAAAATLATYGYLSQGNGGIYLLQIDKALRRQFVKVGNRVIPTEEMVDACLKAVPSLSYTRLVTSFYGGFVVADEKKKEILRRGEMEEKINCTIHTIKEKPTVSGTESDVVWQEALRGNLYHAAILNAKMTCTDHAVIDKQLKKGAIAVSYSPPSIVALHRGIGETGFSVANEPARLDVKQRKILKIKDFLALNPEGDWQWL